MDREKFEEWLDDVSTLDGVDSREVRTLYEQLSAKIVELEKKLEVHNWHPSTMGQVENARHEANKWAERGQKLQTENDSLKQTIRILTVKLLQVGAENGGLEWELELLEWWVFSMGSGVAATSDRERNDLIIKICNEVEAGNRIYALDFMRELREKMEGK
jgi:hypothetical protein